MLRGNAIDDPKRDNREICGTNLKQSKLFNMRSV